MIYSVDLDVPIDLIKYIEETVASLPEHQAVVGADLKTVAEQRSCTVKQCYLKDCWIPGFFDSYIQQINKVHYNYDINAFRNSVEFITYNVGDHYTWHTDVIPLKKMHDKDLNVERKLSFSFICNDDFEGGDLEIWDVDTNNVIPIPPKKGRMIVFPSWLRHRVTPVTKGQRRSIVGWMVGPPWK
jgi:PKHD-type hydroxylase